MKTRDEKCAATAKASPRGAAGAPNGHVWQPTGGRSAVRALASLIPGITRKAFEKHGFASASLITDWAQIVGARLAADTRPLKLKWPRFPEQAGAGDEAAKGRPGATLVLQVDPAVALDVQYQTAQIIERINAYFGYRAVVELRIQQEPIAPSHASAGASVNAREPSAPEQTSTPASPAAQATGSENGLEAALARLGSNIRSRKRSV